MSRKNGLRTGAAIGLSLSVFGGVLAVAPNALAQDAAEEEPDIVVTGSYIGGTPETASLPVDVITAQDLAERGSPTVTELVRSLSVSSGIDGNTNQFTSNGLEGLGNVNLRGLGPSRTLVLFNGHRMVSAPYLIGESAQAFVDTNLIPTNVIGRIEVLKDGAAATYGSDAISGVVNFITRRGFEGFEVGGDYRHIEGSDGEYSVNGLWGWDNGTVDVLVAAAHQHRSQLDTLERDDWALRQFAENPLGGWSAISNPGVFRHPPPLFGSIIADPQCVLLGGIITPGPTCRYQYTQFDNLIEEEDRYQAYGEVNIEVAPNTTFHAEALYAYTDIPRWETSPSFPPQVLTSQFVPGTHPGLLSLIAQTGGVASPFNVLTGGSLFIGRSFALGGFPGSTAGDFGSQTGYRTYEAFRFSAGLSGSFGNGVNWDVSGTFMEDTGERSTFDTYIQRFADALVGLGGPNCADLNPGVRGTQNVPGSPGCLYYNPFSTAIPAGAVNGVPNPLFDPSVANTAALADWLIDPSFTEARTQLAVLDIVLDGELGWTMGGGPVGWALGAQYRVDSFKLDPSDNTDLAVTPCPDPLDTPGVGPCTNATGPYAFLAGTFSADLNRDVVSFFGETRLPFTENFEAILAARYEDYGEDVGSTFDPKISLRWQAADWLAFRGSAQTSFRGPTLQQLEGQFTTLQFVAPTNAFKAIDTFGNPNLASESAFSFNVGAIVETTNLVATIDYWSFSFEDPVIVEPFDSILATVLANCLSVNPAQVALRSRVTFAGGVCAGANVQRVATNIVNGPVIDTSGIDLSLEYTFDDVIGGELTLGAGYTHLIEYVVGPLFVEGVQVTRNPLPALPTPFPYDGDLAGHLNRGTGFRSMPQDKGEVFVNYRFGDHNLRWISRFVSDYQDQRSGTSGIPAGTSIEEQWTHDLHYSWETPWGSRFSASVINVADEDPPLAFLDLNYDPYTHDPVGRVIRIGFSQQFGGP